MKRVHSNNITLILLIPLLVFIGLIVIASMSFKTGKNEETACVLPPDPTKSITFDGEQYDQILPPVEFSSEEFTESIPADWHFKKVSQINGRDVWQPLTVCKGWGPLAGISCDDPGGQNPAPVNWNNDPKTLDLLFVDYSKDFNSTNKYLKYMAIFLKEGTELPSFINEYCAAGFAFKPINYNAEYVKQHSVPYTVDSTKIAYIGSPDFTFENGTYTLFMYEDSKHLHLGFPILGSYSVPTDSGGTKRYNVMVASFAQFLELYAPGDPVGYLYSKNVIPNSYFQPTVTEHKNLQLETFYPTAIGAWGWWNPECKPAIYLYPEKTTDVHVVVDPAGYLTYTDPVYPADGWRVTAHTDGSIVSQNKTYPYLYYESKIRDAAIRKPTEGYIVTPQELPALFSTILPKLGLSVKEVQDFKAYWETKLTDAPYYFVGIMQSEAIDAIEPLTIRPKADTIIRVRLYFEALEKKRSVVAPTITTPQRSGFVVSEWGGLVKTDKNHPFTCSQ